MHPSTENILEAFLLSDQTIAIDFDKFEAGGRLFIIGLSGSGKTSVGKKIAKKYKAPICSLDSAWYWMEPDGGYKNLSKKSLNNKFEKTNKMMKDMVSNKRGCRIVEGIQLAFPLLYDKYSSIFMNEACIIMGKSHIIASIDAAIRNKREGYLFLQTLKNQYKTNQHMKRFLDRFRKERIKNGKNIQPFTI